MAYNPTFRRTHSSTTGFVYYASSAQVDLDTYAALWEEYRRRAEEEFVCLTTRATYRDFLPGTYYEIGGWYQGGTYTEDAHMRTMWLHIHENAVRSDDFPIVDHGGGLWSAVTNVVLSRDKFMEIKRYINKHSTIDDIMFYEV